MTLPADIKQVFFETLYGDKTVLEFEVWLYANKNLDNILNPEDYLELISLGYKSSTAKYDLAKLLEPLVDKGEYEKWKLLKMLAKALQRDKELPQLLMSFYDLYCKGYSFLDNLGLGYGLAVEVPYSQADTWDELSVDQQQKLLASFYPQLNIELTKVIDWLNSGKIILTGNKDQYNYYFDYVDNRNDEEKKPTAYQIAWGLRDKTAAYTRFYTSGADVQAISLSAVLIDSSRLNVRCPAIVGTLSFRFYIWLQFGQTEF